MALPDVTPGTELHGFTVRRVVPLPELNATAVELSHRKTGARYLHLASADDNNLFAVGFRTPPRDSTGVAHILEHTTLCGSKRYPVRDPFFSMLKRTLSTFMNALTADDWTLYPFASQNRADFYNLISVYLDAVFFPLLRERDFRQEGHRLEFEDPADPDSPLTIKGVVYNEMKGAMSDPYSLLETRLTEALYPTTTYGKNSGGEPARIPELTWEALRAFHAACYHPSNAYLFSYGNFPLADHLKVVEEQALGRFEAAPVETEVPEEVRFGEPKEVAVGYPVDKGEELAHRSMVQVGWLTCYVGDHLERLGLMLLSELLLGNPAAPLHKALLDSKLGTNLAPGTGYNPENRDTYFAAGLQGTDPESAPLIRDLIFRVLEECARDGFAAERIEAALHQLEFAHREVKGDHYPYALGLLTRLMGPWIHGADPIRPLLLSESLAELRSRLEGGRFFRDLIRRELLENPHRITLILRPDPELRERQEEELAGQLRDLRSRLGPEEREQLLAKARDLAAAQESPEDLSCLPSLELGDIPREERTVSAREEGEALWFDQPTNGIGYFLAQVELGGCPEDVLSYLPLFCTAFGQVGAAGRPYTEIAERIAASTGGVAAGTTILDDPERLGAFGAIVEIEGKALVRNQTRLFAILRDLFRSSEFTDLERIHTIFNQLKTNLENSLPNLGHRYAARLAASSLTAAGRLRERWSGVEYLRFVRGLAGKPAPQLREAAERLQALAAILGSRAGLRPAVTGEGGAFPKIREPLGRFLDELPREAPPRGRFEPQARPGTPFRRGVAASVPVSYVARVYPCVQYSHPDAAALTVLAKLLRAGYLHREIREKGGAYGGMAVYGAESGLLSLLSYRDPQLARTLKVFDEAAGWAAAGRFGAGEVKEAILGVFSDLDRPLSPGSKGARELGYRQQGLSKELRQAFRERVLATEAPELSRVAEKYLVAGRPGSAVGVIAGEEALRSANAELGEGEELEIEKL
ncbi:MAG: insulinase family protein [Deltaproteobacteria bacterium]|nr:insulinase family protein [Deltaproteobacteria bacterium]